MFKTQRSLKNLGGQLTIAGDLVYEDDPTNEWPRLLNLGNLRAPRSVPEPHCKPHSDGISQ